MNPVREVVGGEEDGGLEVSAEVGADCGNSHEVLHWVHTRSPRGTAAGMHTACRAHLPVDSIDRYNRGVTRSAAQPKSSGGSSCPRSLGATSSFARLLRWALLAPAAVGWQDRRPPRHYRLTRWQTRSS